jgi:TRAP-type C4-dicarboxylate transport system permease small subunit
MLTRIERLLLDAAVLATLLLGVLITGNVLGRLLFGAEIPDSIIMVRELMVAAILLPLAAATAARAHVSVTFITDKLPTGLRARIIVFGWVVGIFAVMPLLFAGWRQLVQAWVSAEYFFGDFDLPRWPGRLLFLLGMSFLWLRLVLITVQDIRSIRASGDVAGSGLH